MKNQPFTTLRPEVLTSFTEYQPDRASDRPKAGGRSDPREGWDRGPKRVRIVPRNIWKARAVRVKNPRAVPLVITRAGTPVSNVIAAQTTCQDDVAGEGTGGPGAVTFLRCPPSDTHADQKGGRLRFLKAAAITVLILVAVTSIAGVVMITQSLSNTGEDKPAINLPPYGIKGDDQAGSGDSEGLFPHSEWKGVRVKPRDFVGNDTGVPRAPDDTASNDAPLISDAMISVTPPTGHAENAQVPDNQTETYRSEGWKRFRVEQNHTEGVDSTTEVPTVPPHAGDEEREVTYDWGYTTGGDNVRVRRRVSKAPCHDSETYPATDDSSDANMSHLEPKPGFPIDQKVSSDVDRKRATAMDTVHAKNSTDLNLYLDAVVTENIMNMKSRKRKHHHRRVLKRIKRHKRSKVIIVLAAVGVLIAGSMAHVCLGRIVQ
ncbi:Tubulointerstitial nephritis antigen-like [Branchiostoma belcheri]|nr:Tubulointerstitial nephritis antigen-like [Branchiostoma belcheri]